MSIKDYYSILGVNKSATEADIKQAFRKLAHKYHPDKSGGDEKKFKEISEAYAVLSDQKRRAQYDRGGQAFGGQNGFDGGFDFSGFDFSQFGGQRGTHGVEFDLGDIFGDFFGGGRSREEMRGRDISIDIELSFKESVFGVDRRVLMAKVSACDTCGGSGAKKGTKTKTCVSCNGKGSVRESRASIFGSISMTRKCDTCNGIGNVPQEVCDKCKGGGVYRRQEEVLIAVPAGVDDGEMMRMPGFGEATKGGVSGDLYVKIHVRKDTQLKREGANISMDYSIKLTDALLGAEHTISTLDGSEKLIIPAGISHGEVLRLRNKGVPTGRATRGDMLVRISILIPKKLSKDQKELIDKMRSTGL